MFADTTVWYNGDFTGGNALSNAVNTGASQSYVYDNFIVPTADGHSPTHSRTT